MSGLQNKSIKKVLDEKLYDWVSSLEDGPDREKIARLIRDNAIVSGGSIASMCMGEKIHDFDVYFRTKEAAQEIAQYYVDQFIIQNGRGTYISVYPEVIMNIKGEMEERILLKVKSQGIDIANDHKVKEEENFENDPEGDIIPEDEEQEADKPKYRPVFLSSNAISLSNRIQLVIRFFGEPSVIHRNYDYIHAMCYYDWKKNELSTPEKALRSMQSRTLYYAGSLYPICSLFRMRKFINRGWKISAGEIFKMCFQISRIDLTNPATLRDQLTGCDAAYFYALIAALNSLIEKNGGDLEGMESYIFSIVDTIFGNE